MKTKYYVSPGVLTENIGTNLLVVVPGKAEVVSLTGRPAEVLLDVQAGKAVVGAEDELNSLANLGILTAAGLSRRGLIKAGAIGAGAGIAVLAMPSVAAASSGSCFSPSSFDVGVGLNDSDDGWEFLTVNFDRPNIPAGLSATIPNGHPGTFTPTSGSPIAVVWQSANNRFATPTFLDPVIPFEQEMALRLGSVTFTLNGCSYTGTGSILEM